MVASLEVLELASERVFVPLTVGGGIRSYTDDEGKVMTIPIAQHHIIQVPKTLCMFGGVFLYPGGILVGVPSLPKCRGVLPASSLYRTLRFAFRPYLTLPTIWIG